MPNTPDPSKAEALLDAVERIHWDHGPLGHSIRRVAEQAERTTQTVYTYFGDRQGLLEHAYDRAMTGAADMAGRLEQAADVAEAARLYRSWAIEWPARWAMVSTGRVPEHCDPEVAAGIRDRIGWAMAFASDAPELPEVQLLLVALDGLIGAELHGTLNPSMAELLASTLVDRIVPAAVA